jgi:hypothetical protein
MLVVSNVIFNKVQTDLSMFLPVRQVVKYSPVVDQP